MTEAEQLTALKAFARDILRKIWEGGDVDGGEAQELAYGHGLIVDVPFDPEKHDGEGAEFCEPGDDWYELADWLKEPT